MNGSFVFRAAITLNTVYEEPFLADRAGVCVCVCGEGRGALVRRILSKVGRPLSAYELEAFVGALTELRKATIRFVMSICLSVCLSVRPHGTTRLPPEGLS